MEVGEIVEGVAGTRIVEGVVVGLVAVEQAPVALGVVVWEVVALGVVQLGQNLAVRSIEVGLKIWLLQVVVELPGLGRSQ